MSHFREFGSFEEMLDFMARSTDAANASLTDEQKALTWGSYWFRPYDGIAIFGYCFTQEEMAERERWSYHRGGPLDAEEEAEFAWTMEHAKVNHDRGYLFGEAFSLVEPTGELGDVHRASAWPIEANQFELAKQAGWDPNAMLVRAWLEPLILSIKARSL